LRWYTLFAVACLFGVGCNSPEDGKELSSEEAVSSARPTTLIPSVSDDQSAVATVEAAAKQVRRDGDGLIIDVDFRDGEPSLEALDSLAGLPRLRAVRLGGTGVGDEACRALGKLEAIEDLDLRDCPVSDAGMESLSKRSKHSKYSRSIFFG